MRKIDLCRLTAEHVYRKPSRDVGNDREGSESRRKYQKTSENIDCHRMYTAKSLIQFRAPNEDGELFLHANTLWFKSC